LSKISRNQGITVAELAQANNLSTKSTLQIGQQLTIPGQAASSVEMTGAADPMVAAAATQSYTVRKGDSLWKIAREHQVSVASLKQANGLSGDLLKIGQQLKLPATTAPVATAATVSPAAPTVQAGVSTWSALSEFREPGTYTENGQTLHFVDLNETPAIIARKYGIKTEELMKANNIANPRQIHYGQRLVIPVAGQPQAARPAAAPVTAASVTLR
ncbi:LysM peptidoglycan-binding domain-containing protein, partial [bacterium]|nr:LysM peptidoglycan-binding domain-containing protein [bacterium]